MRGTVVLVPNHDTTELIEVPLHLKLAWSVPEFAALCSLSPQTIRREIERGNLACRRIGARQIIPRDAGLAFVNGATSNVV